MKLSSWIMDHGSKDNQLVLQRIKINKLQLFGMFDEQKAKGLMHEERIAVSQI